MTNKKFSHPFYIVINTIMRDFLECEIKHRQFKEKYPLSYEFIVEYKNDIEEEVTRYLAKVKFSKKLNDCNTEELIAISKILNGIELVDEVYMHLQTVGFGLSPSFLQVKGINLKHFHENCLFDLAVEFRERLDDKIKDDNIKLGKPYNFKEIAMGIRFSNLAKANTIDLWELFYTYFNVQLKFNQYDNSLYAAQPSSYKNAIKDYRQLEKFSYKSTLSADAYFISQEVHRAFPNDKNYTALNLSHFDEAESAYKAITEFLRIYLSNRLNNNQDMELNDQLGLDLYKIKEHMAIADIINLLETNLDKSPVRQYNSHLSTIISLICWDIEKIQKNEDDQTSEKRQKRIPIYFQVMQLIAATFKSKGEKFQSVYCKTSKRILKINYLGKEYNQINSLAYTGLTTSFSTDSIRKNFDNFKQVMDENFLQRKVKVSK